MKIVRRRQAPPGPSQPHHPPPRRWIWWWCGRAGRRGRALLATRGHNPHTCS